MLARHSCQTCGVDHRRQRLADSRLYLVCDEQPERFLHAVLDGGVDVIQLRCKHAADERILAAAGIFARVCAEHGALFILNDRPDLVARAGADGVHVGQDDVAPRRARELIGPERLIGLSTHSPTQIDAADGEVDYIGVGPVHATPTKPGRPAVGLELVRYAAAHARTPFFAIGGIAPDNVSAVRTAGASRVAVVRALTDAEHSDSTARRLRSAIAAHAQPTEETVGTT